MTPEAFLRDAHRNGHRGPTLLRRWAMARNSDRRNPGVYVTEKVLAEAVWLEQDTADELAGVER